MDNLDIPNSSTGDDIDVKALLTKFKQKWHYFVISFVGFILAAFLYMKIMLPVYEATSSILIKQPQVDPTQQGLQNIVSGDFFGSPSTISTEIGIINSRTVVMAAIRKLDLENSYWASKNFIYYPLYKEKIPFRVEVKSIIKPVYDSKFHLELIDENTFELSCSIDKVELPDFEYDKIHKFGEKIVCPQFSIVINRVDSVKFNEEKYKFVINDTNTLITSFLSEITVASLDKDANIAVLTMDDNLYARANDFLDAMAEAYLNMDVKDKTETANLTLRFVDDQLDKTSSMLSQVENELQAFKERKGIIDISSEEQAGLDRVTALDEDKAKMAIELKSLDYIYDYVTKNKNLENLAPSVYGTDDALLISLVEKLEDLQNKKKGLSYGTKIKTPAIKIIDSEIEDVKKSLVENLQNIRNKLKVALKEQNDQISDYEGTFKKMPAIEKELVGIQRQFDVNQNIYVFLLQKKAETQIAKATVISDNKVLDYATSDILHPVSPKKVIVIVLTLLFALLVPSMIIILKTFFSTTINNRDDLTSITQIPLIGVIGHLNKGTNLVVLQKPKSSISEAFRSIRTNLQFFGTNESKKVILITSSVGGEGKSFCSLNLAYSLAILNNKVVILGMDLRKPKLFQDFELDNSIGISSYLIGRSTQEQIIQKTFLESLDIISAGLIPPNPSELISKPEFASID